MIHIIGDTFEELADLQTLLETEQLNFRKDIKVDVTYELSLGGTLLVDKHNHIIGSSEPYKDFKNMKIF